jgi:hypothetical protein
VPKITVITRKVGEYSAECAIPFLCMSIYVCVHSMHEPVGVFILPYAYLVICIYMCICIFVQLYECRLTEAHTT